MRELPDFLQRHMEGHLLGRLRLRLYEEITGQKNVLPESRGIRKFIRQQFRSNVEAGFLYFHILNLNSSERVDYSTLDEPDDVEELLNDLEHNPLDRPVFFEITKCPKPFPESFGALLIRERLQRGGYVYVMTLLTAELSVIGRFEIRASQFLPRMFSILRAGKFENYDLSNYRKEPLLSLAINILKLASCKHEITRISLSEATKNILSDSGKYDPPTDPELMKLLALALKGIIPCHKTKAQINSIQPFDLDFCMSYPFELVSKIASRIRDRQEDSLLVYWDGKKFIMSDDYAAYLAYRQLGYESVPVVIIGELPDAFEGNVESGGAELIPSLGYYREPDYKSLEPELKNWLLQERLRRHKEYVPAELYGLLIRLARLLQMPKTPERELHELLLEHPIALDPHGVNIMSELRLGKQYRVDLVLQNSFTERRTTLIELERANIKIFTKKGRLTAPVVHAAQQVDDWLRWWREHPAEIPSPLDGSIPPEGFVVVGRNVDMDEDARRRLIHLNKDRTVKILTYDDLLDRIESLIENIET